MTDDDETDSDRKEVDDNADPRTDRQARRGLLADLFGLHRVCVVRRCRRNRRCLIIEAICVQHHEGLLRRRIDAVIAPEEPEEDDEEDENEWSF